VFIRSGTQDKLLNTPQLSKVAFDINQSPCSKPEELIRLSVVMMSGR
jgi:hypothetical protein